jgi:hypothetical protein
MKQLSTAQDIFKRLPLICRSIGLTPSGLATCGRLRRRLCEHDNGATRSS